MKKLAIITGGMAFTILPIGILFEAMHWPGAGILLFTGIGLFSTLFVPSLTIYLYNKEQ